MNTKRKINEIAFEIWRDWKTSDRYAKPYIDAMFSLESYVKITLKLLL